MCTQTVKDANQTRTNGKSLGVSGKSLLAIYSIVHGSVVSMVQSI